MRGGQGRRRAGSSPSRRCCRPRSSSSGDFKDGSIRDGGLLTIGAARATDAWSCDSDDVLAAFDAERLD
jgi:hypothetical protein